ncbi:MAG: DUF3710 domain-containing protein [Corynebacterium sp.]|nr:DUF3710 domain-containing protein [Corynebacterium sp.]
MAIWPFGKKNDPKVDAEPELRSEANQHTQPENVEPDSERASATTAVREETTEKAHSLPHNAVDGESGPFDGDAVDIKTFDFSDFSNGILDLGSLKIPLPKDSQVQVEMGPQGPKMLHIITRFGRITPVAFAAPRNGGQWVSSVAELETNIHNDGMETQLEDGPWGSEIVAQNHNGLIRIIGIEGPRWLLRFTLAAPAGNEEGLVTLGRDVAARTFVYRGDAPILAGNSLPVTMPPQLAQQVQDEMKRRAGASAEASLSDAPSAAPSDPADHSEKLSQAEAARRLYEMLGGNRTQGADTSNPAEK